MQFGSELVGTGASGAGQQGSAVALSANRGTLIEGGPFDKSSAGAAWVFVAPDAVAFTASPSAGQDPLAVAFSAGGLTLPMTYTVNFGDGTVGALNQSTCADVSSLAGASAAQCSGSASHTFRSAGTYTATLSNASGVAIGSATITVSRSTASVSSAAARH